MNRLRRCALAVSALAALVGIGCSGGHSSAGLTPPVQQPTSRVPVSPTQSSQSAAVSLSVVIDSPQTAAVRRKRPAYVSPSTNSLSFTQQGGAAQVISLAATSPACSTASGTRTCVVNLSATPGSNQTFVIKLFASNDGSGTPLSAQTLVENVVAGRTNPIAATLNGVVSQVALQIANASLQYGQSGATNVVVNGLDAAGQTIVGPGVFADVNGNPISIALTDNDSTGSTSLGQSAVTGPATVPLNYNGGPIQSVSITASFGTSTASAMLAFDCGSPAASNALYLAGTLSGSATAPYVEGYGEFPLTQGGAGAVPSNEVAVPDASELAVDNRGFAYVTAYATPGEYVGQYCPSASGTAMPYRSYLLPTAAPSAQAGSFVDGVTVDKNDRVLELLYDYTASSETGTIDVFAKDSGTIGAPVSTYASPAAVIDGTNTFGAGAGYVATDPSSNIFVSNAGTIFEFPQGSSGAAAPSATISDTAGGLLSERDVKADAAGNVYVLYGEDNLTQISGSNPFGPYAIVEYAHGSYTSPARIIAGPATQLGTVNGNAYSYGFVDAIALDPSANIYVLETAIQDNSNNTYTAYNGVAEFSESANGNAAPSNTFAVTGISDEDLAVDGAGHVAVAEADGYGILLYTNGAYAGQIGVSANVGLTEGITYDASGNLYVQSLHYTDVNNNQHGVSGILTFPAPVAGGESPGTIDPIGTNDYTRLAVDAGGEVLGDDYRGIDVYAAGDTSGTPARTIADGLVGGTDYSTGLGLDATGTAYLGFEDHSFTDALPTSTGGTVQPLATYYDTFGSTLYATMAIDASGTVYAASCESNSIAVFAAGSSTPSRQIVGPQTSISCPESIALDANANLYVLNSYSGGSLITVFGPGANGNVAPMQSFTSATNTALYSLAIGPAFGTSGTSAIARLAHAASSSIGLRPGRPQTNSSAIPVCAVSGRAGIAADSRYAHAPGASRGTALPGRCEDPQSRKARLLPARLRAAKSHSRVNR